MLAIRPSPALVTITLRFRVHHWRAFAVEGQNVLIIVVVVQNWRPHAQVVQIHEEVLRYRFFFRASPDGIEAWLKQFLDGL